MMCLKARRWFGAYWDDEITQAEREWLEAHFAGCPRCRAEYEGFAHTLESVASLPRHEASPDFVELTLARARRATTVPDSLPTPRPMWAPVAVAASLLVVTATLLAPWVERGAHVTTAQRPVVPHEARLVAAQAPAPAPLVNSPVAGVTAPVRVPAPDQVAALVDSLIDHGDDVDFVLDPVRVSRERTAGRRLEPVQGQQAVIKF